MPENSKPKQNARSRKRLYSLIAVFVFVGGATCFYIRYSVARPVGRGPAGPAVDRTDFRDVWTGRKIHVVGVGDSITAGLGAAKPSHSYFNRVIENPRDEFADLQGVCLSAVLPNLTYENFAISGSESATHLDVIHESVPTYDDDVFGIVLMTSGGNDLIHMYGRSPPRECAMYGATLQQAKPWIKSYTQRLRTMLEKLDSKFPGGCEIFIANIYDPTDGVGDAPSIFLPDWPDGLAIHSKYNEAIRVVAAKMDNAHVVDLHKTFLGHGSHCRQFWRESYCAEDPHYWFFTNVEDPNDRGYDAIRRAFLNSIVAKSCLRADEDNLVPANKADVD